MHALPTAAAEVARALVGVAASSHSSVHMSARQQRANLRGALITIALSYACALAATEYADGSTVTVLQCQVSGASVTTLARSHACIRMPRKTHCSCAHCTAKAADQRYSVRRHVVDTTSCQVELQHVMLSRPKHAQLPARECQPS